MLAVPVEIPATTPVAVPTVAIAELDVLHEPPPVAEERVVLEPTQVLAVPLIAAGSAFTVTVAVRRQPVDKI